jgi:hypothetical protein
MVRFSVVTVLLVLVALVSVLRAEPKPPPDNAPKLAFPKVEGWEKSDLRPLSAESGGGYSVGYNCDKPRIALTVYVFNRGLAKIDNDLTSAPIREEFISAKAAIVEATLRGLYKDSKEEESGEATIGPEKSGVKALYARYLLTTEDDRKAVSEIYVLPYHNYFVKLRVTRVGEEAKAAQAPLDRLYAAFAKMLAE